MLIEAAREQMIHQQVRAWDVLDERVLEVLGRVPRERFVPEAYHELAFADTAIPGAKRPVGSHNARSATPASNDRTIASGETRPTMRCSNADTATPNAASVSVSATPGRRRRK